MNTTIFKKEVKHKPINNQTSMIVRKASAELLHTPPNQISKTNLAPTQKEKVDAYCAGLRKNIKEAKKWKAEKGNRKTRQLKKWLEQCRQYKLSQTVYNGNISTFNPSHTPKKFQVRTFKP